MVHCTRRFVILLSLGWMTVFGTYAQQQVPAAREQSKPVCDLSVPPTGMHYVCLGNDTCNCLLEGVRPTEIGPLPTNPVDLSTSCLDFPVIDLVAPVYPPIARKAGIAGTVSVRLAVAQSGEVSRVEILQGPGPLRKAALDAVKQWKFKPREHESYSVFKIKFSLLVWQQKNNRLSRDFG